MKCGRIWPLPGVRDKKFQRRIWQLSGVLVKMLNWNSHILKIHLKYIITHLKFLDMLSNVFSRYNVWIDQLVHYKFQIYFQSTTELSELINWISDIFSRYHKTVWINQCCTKNFRHVFNLKTIFPIFQCLDNILLHETELDVDEARINPQHLILLVWERVCMP